jgi:gas vesicle protein
MTMNQTANAYDDLTLDRATRERALAAFACGALAGVTAGILLAPFRGVDTRRRLVSTARDGYDRASRFVTHSRRAVAKHRARLTAVVDQSRQRLETGTRDVADALRDAGAAVDRVRDRLAR